MGSVRLTVFPSGSWMCATRCPHGMLLGGPSTRPPRVSTCSSSPSTSPMPRSATFTLSRIRCGASASVTVGHHAEFGVADLQADVEGRAILEHARDFHGAEQRLIERQQQGNEVFSATVNPAFLA